MQHIVEEKLKFVEPNENCKIVESQRFNKETNIKKEGDFIPTMELKEGNIGKRMKSLIPL